MRQFLDETEWKCNKSEQSEQRTVHLIFCFTRNGKWQQKISSNLKSFCFHCWLILFVFIFMYTVITKLLRIHLRLSTILKASNKIVWSNVFWYIKEIKLRSNTYVQKIYFGQNKRYKNTLFFLSWAPTITVLLLMCDSYMSWSTGLVYVCGEFSIYDSVSLLLMFIFLFKKKHWVFDFKTS